MTQEVSFTILGEPASKANSRRLVSHGGVPMFIKSTKAMSYSSRFHIQLPKIGAMMEGDLGIEMKIYYASYRPDLDESLILDLLQGHIYKNDRQIKEKHIYHGIDKVNPRSDIRVYRINH